MALHGALLVPLVPEEARRLTLQNDGEGEACDVHGVEDTRPEYEAVNGVVGGARENSHIEEDDGSADQPPRYGVQAHVDPEDQQQPGDVVEGNVPHVLTHTKHRCSDVCCCKGSAARLLGERGVRMLACFLVSSG